MCYCHGIKEALDVVFKRSGVSKQDIAAELDMTSQAFSDGIKRVKNPKWSLVLYLIDRLGYRMVLVPKDEYVSLNAIEVLQEQD